MTQVNFMLIGGVNNLPSHGNISITSEVSNQNWSKRVTVFNDDVTTWQVWTSLEQNVGLYTCTIEYYQCSRAKHDFWYWFHTLSLKWPIKIGRNWSFTKWSFVTTPNAPLPISLPIDCHLKFSEEFNFSSWQNFEFGFHLNLDYEITFRSGKIGKLYLAIPSSNIISPCVSELLLD